MGSKTSFICPYCFEKHRLKEVQFRCINPGCADCADPELTASLGLRQTEPLRRKRTFTVPMRGLFSVEKEAACPDCGTMTGVRVCPGCHNPLPDSTLRGEDLIISVVGARGSGKSHFLGVLLKMLDRRIAPAFEDGAVESFDDSYGRWQASAGIRLYRDRKTLPPTVSSICKTDTGVYRPLVFKLKSSGNGLPGSRNKLLTLLFFDAAGEDLGDPETMKTAAGFIGRSAGIIFLLDPNRLPGAAGTPDRDLLPGASCPESDPGGADAPEEVLRRVADLIRSDKKTGQDRKIDIPIAAVLSKFDLIESQVPPELTICRPSPHCEEGCFDRTDRLNVSLETEGLLREWGAGAFLDELDRSFSHCSFFTVSTLGFDNSPDENGSIRSPLHPHRIEDPLLWILKEKRKIPVN